MGLTGGGGGEGEERGVGRTPGGEDRRRGRGEGGEGGGRKGNSLNTVQLRDGKAAGADPEPTLPAGRPAPLGSA